MKRMKTTVFFKWLKKVTCKNVDVCRNTNESLFERSQSLSGFTIAQLVEHQPSDLRVDVDLLRAPLLGSQKLI